MTYVGLGIVFIGLVYFFSRKKKGGHFDHRGVMFDFSRMPNSDFNKKKDELENHTRK